MLGLLAERMLEELAEDEDGSVTSALLGAAYGYTRNNRFSPLMALAFGIAAFKFPALSSIAIAADATLVQDTPARRYAAERGQEFLERRAAYVKRAGL
jgi:hypothetical protein